MFASWPDIVLTIVSLIKIYSMFPSLFSTQKPAAKTCWGNTICGVLTISVYAALGTWFAFGTTLFHTMSWFVLGIQAKRQYAPAQP